MEKRKGAKCLLSILLAICMICGAAWIPQGGQAEAAGDVKGVTFYKTGRWMAVAGTRIVTESDLSAYAGYCKATVLLDGKKQLVDWQIAQAPEPTQGGANRWSLVSRQDTANGIPSGTKSLIIPKGTIFYKTDDTPILQAEADFALTYAGNYTEWPEGFTDAGFTMRWISDQSNGDTYVALNVDKTISDLSTVYSSGTKFSSMILVDGVEKAVTWEYIISGENQLIRSDYNVDSVNYIATEASIIEIPEGTFLISRGEANIPVKITKEIVLSELGTNNWVEGCMDMELSYVAVYPQTDFLQAQFAYSADLGKITETNPYVYLDTEIDGAVVENVKWVINQSAGKIYPDGTGTTVPATAKSVKIYAGTFSGGYAGTSCKVPIRIKNDIGAVYVSGAWRDASTVRTVNAVYKEVVGMNNRTPQIKLTVDSVITDEWKGWFNGKAYVENQEVAARFYFEPNTQTLLIGQNVGETDASDNVMKALEDHKTVKIKAAGELTPVQGQPGSVVLNLEEDLILSWNGSEYVSGETGPQELSTNVSYRRIVEGEEAYQLHLTVDNYDDLVSEYGLWSWFEGTMKVNGEDKIVAFQLGSNLFATLPSAQNANAGLPVNTTSFEIPEGTTFTDVDGSSVKTLKISNSLSYVKVDGNWYAKGQEPREITTNLSYRSILEGEEAYQVHLTVDNYNELVSEYGLWSWFEGTIKVNGEDRTVAFQLGSNLFATLPSAQNANAGLPLDAVSFEIPEGTIFIDVDGSSINLLKTTNRLSYVKKDGIWYAEGQVPKEIITNMSYRIIMEDGDVYRLHMIVDNYDELVKEYGLWSWFEGKIIVNGEKRMVAFNLGSDLFATFSSKQNVNAGIPLDATSIEIPAGTVFTDVDGSSANLLKVATAIALEKEPVYGRWGLKGTISTPTKFNDIEVNVYTLTGVYISLGAQTEKNWLTDIYGKGARFYGEAIIGDPEKGVYTNENMLFNLSGDQLVTSTVQIGLMDSFEIKAGTILWPDAGCKSQEPIRIMTNVRLTRDAKDDWVIQLNGKTVKIGEVVLTSQASKTSPQTGDAISGAQYMDILIAALVCIGVYLLCGIRRRKDRRESVIGR